MSVTEADAKAVAERGPYDGKMAYENVQLMRPLVEALTAFCQPGHKVIFRRPFRWMMAEDRGDVFLSAHVIGNAYEMLSLESVCRERGWEIIYDFTHAAIVRVAS